MALTRITQDLQRITRRHGRVLHDVGERPARVARQDVEAKLRLDDRLGREIEASGRPGPVRLTKASGRDLPSPQNASAARHLGSSLPANTPISAAERQFAAEAIADLKKHFGPAADLESLVTPIEPGDVVAAARRRATRNAHWWHGLSEEQRSAMVRVRPHLIGNTDGIPYAYRDRANRLAITQDLEAHLVWRPTGRRSGLPKAELMTLRNIVRIRDHLADLERRAHTLGAREVQVLAYNPRAYKGNGRIVVSIGDADRAEIVTRHIGGVGTTARKLENRARLVGNEWEMTTRYAGHNRIASIIDIGYRHPIAMLPPEPAKPIFAEVGGYVVTRDLVSYNATRDAWAGLPGGATEPRLHTLLGHSFGSTTICHAGQGGRLAGEIDQIILSGAPGAGPLTRAADFGIGKQNVYVLASHRDPVTVVGADTAAGQGRFLNTGHGPDPANERFHAVRVAAEPPSTPPFDNPKRIHTGYNAFADTQTRQPTEALHSIALIAAGRGDEAMRVVHRPAVDTPTLRHRIGTLPTDPEQARAAQRQE